MSISSSFDSMAYDRVLESDKEARIWLARHETVGHFIQGAFVAGVSHFDNHEPATNAKLLRVALGTPTEVNAAVQAARAAQPLWAALPGHQRARYLYALARAVQRHARLFAVIEALDCGKPLRETRDIDIPLVIRHFYHHAGWAQLQQSEFPDHDHVGVVGQVIPWSFPLLMLAWKVAPALALGNTVVLKPAELTPLTATLFAEMTRQVGLPDGVFNVIQGDGSTGAALVAHPGLDKISFTGSTEVGRSIRRLTAGSGKSLSLTLGGKSPFIVFDDADQDAAIEGVVDAIWLNQGQVCCAGSRLLVQESVAASFHKKLRLRMDKLRIGSPLDKGVDLAALISQAHAGAVRSKVGSAIAEGATVHQTQWDAGINGGCFFPPTLLSNVQLSSPVAQEEIFGPVLVSMTFRTPDEAVALANNSRYGLAASVWSETISRAFEVAMKLQAGVVWINSTTLFDASAGFGGYRESGYGREGGREGAWEYLKPKTAASQILRVIPEPRSGSSEDRAQPVETIDRTAKLYIGGRQVRPDGNYSQAVYRPDGQRLGEVGSGNRKDIRNAVSAARSAAAWSESNSHHRAQILYFIAENLSVRGKEFSANLQRYTGCTAEKASSEVDASVARLFSYAAWADKFDGAVHSPPMRGVVLAMHEPIGVVGVICPPEQPLLAFVSLVAPHIAMGNRVVAVPSEAAPLVVTDFYQVLDTSDVPDGVVNIITGASADLGKILAEHDDVDALWIFHSQKLCSMAEDLSTGNMKRVWADYGLETNWFHNASEGRAWLRHAVQVKNVWIPYGE